MSKQVFCQSCGMPLDKPSDFGTERNGELSKEYCHYCYQNGEWTDPNISFDEMLALGKKGLDGNNEMGRFMKWFCKLTYPSMLKNMKRWKKS
jgi:hypothetical protein